MVLAVDVSTALLGGSQPTSVAWHWGYSTQPDAVPLRRCIAFDHGLGLRSIWSRGSSDRSRSRAHFTERPGMPGFFSKASLSDFPIFPMSADFFGETGRLDFFFWPIQGLTPKKFIQENWVPECLQDALEGRLESCQRVALLARGWVEMKFWGHVMWSCDLVGEFEHQQPFQQEMVHKWSIHFFHVFHSPLADDDPHWNLPTTDAATWRPVLGYPCAHAPSRGHGPRIQDAGSMTSCHQLGQTRKKLRVRLIHVDSRSCMVLPDLLKVQIHYDSLFITLVFLGGSMSLVSVRAGRCELFI